MVEVSSDTIVPKRVRFHYLKSQLWRVVHVDGAIGGITPRGMIHAAIYNERPAIPQVTEQEVSPEGVLGAQTLSEGKEGVVRELDVDLVMSKQAAIELRDWLAKRVSELDKLEAEYMREKGNK